MADDLKETIVHQSMVIAKQSTKIAELEKEVTRQDRLISDLEYEAARLENKIQGLNVRIHLLTPAEEVQVDEEDVLEIGGEGESKRQRTA